MKIFTNLTCYVSPRLENLDIDGVRTNYQSVNSHHSPSFIVALPFGTTTCNKRLSDSVKFAVDYFELEKGLIAQEIYNFLPQDYKTGFLTLGRKNRSSSLVFSEIDTIKYLDEVKCAMSHPDFVSEIPLYIAHPAHMQRVILTAEKLGIPGFPLVDSTIPWSDRSDHQWWTKNKFLWMLREIPARIYLSMNNQTI